MGVPGLEPARFKEWEPQHPRHIPELRDQNKRTKVSVDLSYRGHIHAFDPPNHNYLEEIFVDGVKGPRLVYIPEPGYKRMCATPSPDDDKLKIKPDARNLLEHKWGFIGAQGDKKWSEMSATEKEVALHIVAKQTRMGRELMAHRHPDIMDSGQASALAMVPDFATPRDETKDNAFQEQLADVKVRTNAHAAFPALRLAVPAVKLPGVKPPDETKEFISERPGLRICSSATNARDDHTEQGTTWFRMCTESSSDCMEGLENTQFFRLMTEGVYSRTEGEDDLRSDPSLALPCLPPE